MQSSESKPAPENERGTDCSKLLPEPVPESVPESVTEHIRKLYAEYIKPEQFILWLVEQEQLKRKLAEQQREFELQYQQSLASIERDKLRSGWYLRCDEQQQRKHLDVREQHDGGRIEDSGSDGASGGSAAD